MTEEKNDHSEFHYHEKLPFLRKRCPNLSEEELKEAEELFLWYVDFVWDLCDEREKEGKPIITEEERKEYLDGV